MKNKHKKPEILFKADIARKNIKNIFNYFDVIVAILALIGTIYVVLTSFEIKANTIILIGFTIVCTSYFSYIFKAAVKKLRVILISLGVLALYGGLAYRHIIDGAIILYDKIVQQLFEKGVYLDKISIFYNLDEGASINIFLIFLIIILSFFITFSVVYKSRILLLLLITFPFLELGVYYGIMPSITSFSILVIAWICTIGMSGSKKNQNIGVRNKVAFILAMFTLVLWGIVYNVYAPSEYSTRPIEIENYKDKIEDIAKNISKNGLYNVITKNKSKGGVDGGILGQISEIEYDNTTDLIVTVSKRLDSNVYLRGFIGCEYNKNKWNNISEDLITTYNLDNNYSRISGFNINGNIANNRLTTNKEDFRSITTGRMKVQNVNANSDYSYMPYNYYNIDNEEKGSKSMEEVFDKYKGEEEYEIPYFRNEIIYRDYDSTDNIDSIDRNPSYGEKGYVNFVYDAYTRLPDDGLDKIKEKYNGEILKNNNVYYCIDEAISAVQDGTKYTLSPGKLPKGKDFVEYFLYESKEGYCTYYATAATVILRAMGVPARYVEGYVIKTNEINSKNTIYKNDEIKKYFKEDNGTSVTNEFEESEYAEVNVLDSAAHAWVEVYIEEIGWVPIEVTPSANVESISNVEKPQDNQKTEQIENNTKAEEPKEQEIEAQRESENIESETTKELTSNTLNNTEIIIAAIFLIVIASIFLILIRHYYIVIKFNKMIKNDSYNRNTIKLYSYLRRALNYNIKDDIGELSVKEYIIRLCREYEFIKEDEFNKILDVIYKAEFSKHKLKASEYDIVVEYVLKMVNEKYKKLSIISKIYFRYILNLK